MNSTPLDIHALIGTSGLLAMFTLSGLNEFLACLVGILTVIYMAIRIVICWRKLK